MSQYINEAKRFQYLAGILNEEVNVDTEFEELGKELASKVQTALQSTQLQEEDLNTAAQVLDVILAAPVVVNFLGDKIADVSASLGIKKGIQFGSWLSKYSSKLEGEFKKPISYVVNKFVKDPKKQETISEALYVAVVLGLGAVAGQGSSETLQQTRASLDVINSLKDAVGGDMNGFVDKIT